jgi:hypothetical protein
MSCYFSLRPVVVLSHMPIAHGPLHIEHCFAQ